MRNYKKEASRAAKRGDVRAADAIEFDYITACVRLYTPTAERYIEARAVRLCRGAGPHGETRVEWMTPGGQLVYSDIEGILEQEYDEIGTRYFESTEIEIAELGLG